ncbi:MAG TPA: bifunctional riboflavin kinase/FAD synthetase [Xanthobacteraceae bacterium]|nr:bifunctional riboflavin kinase/FAD synthetase [Xanthobacteraceae bacterium]
MSDETMTRHAFPVVRDGEELPSNLRRAFVAIGNFDGVHRGHRAVIDCAIELARDDRRPAIALTFEPHPRAFFRKDQPLFRLTPEPEKLRLLAAAGLDGAVVMHFDGKLAAVTAEDFVRDTIIKRLSVTGLVIGDNFQFGRRRQGNADFLREQGEERGFEVEVVKPLLFRGKPVSSSAIREALTKGEVEEAAKLLGHAWFVSGKVIHGEKRGRELGYPTANIELDPNCGLAHGIYAVRARVRGEIRDGVASFGRRPTFGDGAPLLEVFLFGFEGDIYDEEIDVAFLGWIRPEQKFSGAAELTRQMDADSKAAREMLASAPEGFPLTD